MFVHKAALDTPSLPEAIAKAYNSHHRNCGCCSQLSKSVVFPRWPRLLVLLRPRLGPIFTYTYRKTGVNRQADLVKLVAAFSNPLLKQS